MCFLKCLIWILHLLQWPTLRYTLKFSNAHFNKHMSTIVYICLWQRLFSKSLKVDVFEIDLKGDFTITAASVKLQNKEMQHERFFERWNGTFWTALSLLHYVMQSFFPMLVFLGVRGEHSVYLCQIVTVRGAQFTLKLVPTKALRCHTVKYSSAWGLSQRYLEPLMRTLCFSTDSAGGNFPQSKALWQ